MFDRDDVLSLLGQSFTSPLRLGDIADSLGVRKSQQPKLRRLLSRLVDEGEVERIGRGKYAIAAGGGGARAIGRIRVHPAGYGFVEREDGAGDVFVPAKYRGAALDGDRVSLSTWEGFKGTEGKVDRVLARGRAKLTGVLVRAGRTVYLEPDDPRISGDYGRVSLDEGTGGGRPGECVVVEISRYPTEVRPHLAGRVIRVLGDPEDPNTEIEKIIACEDIPVEFPDDALAQAASTPQELRSSDFADRIDLRDRAFLTIDPETARDYDDALCIETGPHGGPRVWVAVADVSHYVHPEDALDQEAVIRGVSVYLPDRAIPMLPEALSSGICSLNPEVNRCAMTVRLDFDKKGRVVDTGFAAAVIRSRARLDYPGVAAALSGDFRGERERYRKWAKQLARLSELGQLLKERRQARGALALEVAEPKVILDADDPRLVRDVVQAKGSEGVKSAYELVESFMIAANEAVGAFFRKRGVDTVWRVHPPPEESRVEELAEVMESFGIYLDTEEAMTPAGMQQVLEEIGDRPAARALSFLVLRTLTQATWDTENVGHFGLASDEYLHFTSPIRRYPDLLVHRLLKVQLHRDGQASGGAVNLAPPPREELQELAATASAHERRATEAEREAISLYRALLMKDQIGEELVGRVSGVASFGVFIEIDEPFVEGLIKLSSLGDDYYDFDPLKMRISGRRSGLTLTVGDPVRVEVANASVTRRQVDFRLVAAERKGRARRSSRKTSSTRAAKTSRDKGKKREKGGSAARGKAAAKTRGGGKKGRAKTRRRR